MRSDIDMIDAVYQDDAGARVQKKTTIAQRLAQYSILIFVFLIPAESLIEKYQVIGSVSRIAGIVAFVVSLIAIFYRRFVYSMPGTYWLLVFFIGWSGLSLIWSKDALLTYQLFLTNIQLIAMFWLLWQMTQTTTFLRSIAKAYINGCFLTCLPALLNFANHNTIGVNLSDDRYSATGYDPNYLGVSLAIAIPMVFYAILARQRSFLSLLYLGYLPLCFVVIILTGSRGALLAAVPAMLPALYTYWKTKPSKKILAIAFVVVTIMSVMNFMPPEQFNRFSRMRDDVSDATGRKEIWLAGWQVLHAHPFLGVGDGAYREAIYPIAGVRQEAHQTFLGALVETGILGSSFLFVYLASSLYLIFRLRDATEKYICIGIYFAWAVGGCSLILMRCKWTWLLFVMLHLFNRFSSAVDSDVQV